jgi:hypothetical protein
MMFWPNLYAKLEKLEKDLLKTQDPKKRKRIAERITVVKQRLYSRELIRKY